MVDIWGTIADTAKAVGKAGIAPAGVVWDLANMPFDDKDDNFGTVVGALSERAGDVLSLAMGAGTPLETPIEKTFEAMNWALDNGINRPISTLTMAAQHAAYQDGWTSEALFDRATWAEAWALSDDTNAGQAITGMLSQYYNGAWDDGLPKAILGSGMAPILGDDRRFDPFAYANPYDEYTHEKFGSVASASSWGLNIAGAVALDPSAAALKGVGAARMFLQYRGLRPAEQASFLALSQGEGRIASRTDKYLDFINGKNSQQRPLMGPEILASTPELRRFGTNPHVIAGLLSDATKLSDPKDVRDAQRRILAVAAGDSTAISRLNDEVAEAGFLLEPLKNMARQRVLDLEELAIAPNLASNPQFIKRLEDSLQNLNLKDNSIDRFIDETVAQGRFSLETVGTLKNSPTVHSAGKRALNRENNTGKLRAPANKTDEWAERIAAKGEGATNIFQQSRYTLPLIAVRGVGGLYAKMPVKVSDALRRPHLTGTLDLDNWGQATSELDSAMRLYNVSDDARKDVLTRAFTAKTEAEKTKYAVEVESLVTGAIAQKWNERVGARLGATIDPEFMFTIVARGAGDRGGALTSQHGRAFASAAMRSEQADRMTAQALELRTKAADRIGDDLAAKTGKPWREDVQESVSGNWTVDMVLDENGLPVHLPVVRSQLTTTVPLIDFALIEKTMSREYGRLGMLSKAWKADAAELDNLYALKRGGKLKAGAARKIDQAIKARTLAMDYSVHAAQMAMRAWKFSVLFRLGYPARVVLDDNARIWAAMGGRAYFASQGFNSREAISNFGYNQIGRRRQASAAMADAEREFEELTALLSDDVLSVHRSRMDELKTLDRQVRGRRSALTKARATGDEDKIRQAESALADREAAREYMIEQIGDFDEEVARKQLDQTRETILAGKKALRDPKRVVGSNDVQIDGVTLPGAFGGDYGPVFRDASKSHQLFDQLVRGGEDRSVERAMRGSFKSITPDEPGHLDAWADALNHHIRNSPEAMHFVRGGTVDEFVEWVRKTENRTLRQRLPHFAYDPEDWGHRIEAMIDSYIPSGAVREAVLTGRVSGAQLRKLQPEGRPIVHGRSLADTIGNSEAQGLIGRNANRMMKFLAEVPTDTLSRHPYFASMYRVHAKEAIARRRAGGQAQFTQKDIDAIAAEARRAALRDVRTTLFDMSAHSHAAHVMRFVSPFFAAHQEALMRWWRIGTENPQALRKIQMLFDAPRHAGIVIDSETGEPVKPGQIPSANHKILLQVPKNSKMAKVAAGAQWAINESSLNLLMPQGPTNPGIGPIVQLPLDIAAAKYIEEPEVRKLSAIFNPYPPQSPFDSMFPATFKRLAAVVYSETGVDPTLGLGIGQKEFNSAFAEEMQDAMVDFHLKHGREPSNAEADELVERAQNAAGSKMYHRLLWNSMSPFPAQPQSKYAHIQQAWYKMREQAKAEGRDFDDTWEQFRAKYGDAFLPLLSSGSKNPAGIDVSSPAWAVAIKESQGTLAKVDPSLTRMVVGPTVATLSTDEDMAAYSQVARNFLRDRQIRPGEDETYYSSGDPRSALDEGMVQRGWQKFNALTAGLDAEAERLGLKSYEDSDQLVAIKRAAVAQLEAENYAWARDYGSFDGAKYDAYLLDMQQIASDPALTKDPQRTDVQLLDKYLQVRQAFSDYFEQSLAAGNGGFESEEQMPYRALFTAIVDEMVRSNTMFQSYMYDGLIERDPMLLRSE